MLSCAADTPNSYLLAAFTAHQESTLDLLFAYIDPGSGSLIIQALIAGMVALPIFFRQQIARAIRVVRGTNELTSESSSTQDDGAANGS